MPLFFAALLVAIIGMLTVFNEQMANYQPVTIQQPTPVVVRQQIAVPTPSVKATVTPRQLPVTTPGDLLAIAQSWLGVRYQWGGCTQRGVDCSCFVQNVLKVMGINAPRTTKPQFAWGTAVAREDVQIGDLVFFNDTCSGCGPNPTHVGMAINNTTMIHCGDPCQVAAISVFPKYAGARRPPW